MSFLADQCSPPCPSQSPQSFHSFKYVLAGSEGMSDGLFPDLRYLLHSSQLSNFNVCTNSLAFSKGLCSMSLGGINPVPSQSPIPLNSFLYTPCISAGISSGFFPDLTYSCHCLLFFNPSECTNSLASLKERYFLFW